MKRRHRYYLAEKERDIHSKILPFAAAMEDLRFTAIEQRNYMINKAIADQYSPALFEHMRKRFHQEDIFIQTPRPEIKTFGKPINIKNQSVAPKSEFIDQPIADKGLFDNRELGYSQ